MSVYTYDDLVKENHRLRESMISLERRVNVLEEQIEASEECFEMDVECQFCGRKVSESRAVSPAGQGIWLCLVCDDELARHRAKYLLKEE